MNKIHRNIYFWFICSVTIISIPLLLLFSSGYRLNLKNLKIIKTGSIYITSTPKNAQIYINNEKYSETTPVLINNLSPNEYYISVQKNGYRPWEKKLLINSSLTTFTTKLFLVKENLKPENISKNQFPQNTPITISADIASIIEQLDLSNNLRIEEINNLIIILDNNNNILYLVKSDNLSLKIEKISPKVTNFQLNKTDNNLLLFNNDLEIWIYNLAKAGPELITRQSQKIHEAIWLQDNYLIYNEANKIILMELDNREPRQIYDLANIEESSDLALDKNENNLFYKADSNYWKINLAD